MSELRPLPPTDVPTLTEVVPESSAAGHDDVPVERAGAAVVPLHPAHAAAAGPALDLDADAVFLDVLDELREQLDRMLDYRLREALAPVVARAVDRLVDEARQELEATLHDVLRRCVAQVIARNRPR